MQIKRSQQFPLSESTLGGSRDQSITQVNLNFKIQIIQLGGSLVNVNQKFLSITEDFLQQVFNELKHMYLTVNQHYYWLKHNGRQNPHRRLVPHSRNWVLGSTQKESCVNPDFGLQYFNFGRKFRDPNKNNSV